jgi:hypothetical protein
MKTIVPYYFNLKALALLCVLSLGFMSRVSAQEERIVDPNHRPMGMGAKTDSTGNSHFVIYGKVSSETPIDNKVTVTGTHSTDPVDTFWTEPKLVPMSRKLQMVHNSTFDSLHKEPKHISDPAHIQKVTEQPK